jgi:hypothetical protein
MMGYQSTRQQAKRKGSHLGLIIVVSTLAVVMLILIAAIGIFIFTSRASATGVTVRKPLLGKRPLDLVEVAQVDPALALASLGGVAEADVVAEAISKARPETAFSALLFNPALNDKESAGSFLLLAATYGHNQAGKAQFSYQMAGTIATLSPDMPDTLRADVFIQAGEGLMEVNEPGLAKFYLDQAFLLASDSPYLQALHRRTIFQRLQKNYVALRETELARRSLNLSANPPPLALKSSEGPILPASGAIPVSIAIQEAETERWRRAQELAALLVERGGNTPPEAKDSLREALMTEDQLKLPFYEAEQTTAAQLSRKIDATVAKIEWLSIKYRVARRAYGIDLVPEWEAQAEQIRADLTKTYETLYALYADLIVALPEVSQIDKATEERLRREILAGELGRYPNYPEEQRRKQLLDATNQLMLTQPELNIFVSLGEANNQDVYTLVSAAER